MLSGGTNSGKTLGFSALTAAFAFVVAYIALRNVGQAAIFFGVAVANYGAFQLGKKSGQRALGVFAVIAAGLALTPMFTSGASSIWTICSIGLFNSIMFPTIFTLGIAKLGRHTPQGSGALCVGIVGGAVIPVLWGLVSDATASVTIPFAVCAACYAYIAYYAFIGSKPETLAAT